MAQFVLKIVHLTISMELRGPRARGFLPRLWLLAQILEIRESQSLAKQSVRARSRTKGKKSIGKRKSG